MVAAFALVAGTTAALGAVEVRSYNLQLLDVPGITSDNAFSTAWAINSERRIVGWYPAGSQSSSNPAAFVAGPDGKGGYTVTVFPTSGGLSWVQPYDLNDTGVIVGQSRTNTARLAFAFGNSAPADRLLGASSNDESEATGINHSKEVVGWRTSGSRIEAFYLPPGTTQPQQLFSSGPPWQSRALGINDRAQIAGYYISESGSKDYRGFIYDWDSKKVTELGSITVPDPSEVPPLWRLSYDAVAINNKGEVAATRVTSGLNHAILFDGTNTTDLGVVGAYEESFAAGISDTGWVVGFLLDADKPLTDSTRQSGFLWVGGQMLNLRDMALAQGWDGITVVHDAYSYIVGNEQKGFIVGQGVYQGSPRAFAMEITLQIPEPQIYLILGVGLIAIGALRLRRVVPH